MSQRTAYLQRCGLARTPQLLQGDLTTARNAAPQIADSIGETDFDGYTALSTQATVRALLVEGKPASSARAGQAVEIVLDRSPFYAESGGQVGDKGLLHVLHDAGQLSVEVSDVQKVGGGRLFLHYGTVVGDGELKVGAPVKATVDATLRRRVRALLLPSRPTVLTPHPHGAGSLQPHSHALAAGCAQTGHGRRYLPGGLVGGL
jgi:alanyl-tRNA synthetase